MEVAQFKRFRKFALKFVEPLTTQMNLEDDSIQITTNYEGKTVVFIVCGIEEKGVRNWEVSFVHRPKNKDFKSITTYL